MLVVLVAENAEPEGSREQQRGEGEVPQQPHQKLSMRQRALTAVFVHEATLPVSSRQAREAIRAPVLASHTVVNEEQALRVVLLLYRPQPRVVLSPIVLLPPLVEEVALGDIGARIRRDLAQLRRRALDRARIPVGCLEVHRRLRHSRISGAFTVGDDGERKSPYYARIGRGVESTPDRLLRCTREALVEVQLDLFVAAAREQRPHEARPLTLIEERSGQPQRVVGVQKGAHLS